MRLGRIALRTVMTRAGVMLLLTGLTSPAIAQQAPAQVQTLRVEHRVVVMDQPRGDAIVVGSIASGTVVEVLRRERAWYLVRISPSQEGWVHATAFTSAARRTVAAHKPAARGSRMIRGFAQTGGVLFTAKDSFDAIFGLPVGWLSGGGGQVVFPNGAFVQANIDRFQKTGTQALVSGTQVFIGNTPDTITVMPISATVGYRAIRSSGLVPYVGAGLGAYAFKERAASLLGAQDVSDVHVGYHLLGGTEIPVARWLWIAGEIQWSAVPKALGQTGLSAVYKETDLGGTTVRVKVIFGR
ncbi:MAG TPA: SH3 domain-containing protein [Vicinamibacterales bacterium]|nr:SH3 domain-containing protein [Vicinamibacterales bacterium]